jgi:hypothetical protein
VSVARGQAQLDVPVEALWALLGDPNRYPEWWPRIIDVKCDDVQPGCEYKHVSRGPVGTAEETILIEQLDDCREVRIRCLDTGTYMRWVLMPVQDGTFLDVTFGMEPARIQHRVFDRLAGRRFYRRWLEESLDALRGAAQREGAPPN